ncbi:K(+) efflux antiporter 2, chloroplastic-like [Camellia sinensis]|uniref:K(+) efflux antiporter 2, chloroplastic-like n=1 Tax=Camellia sinensis TaxID=4442 RepID=UPI001035A72F|nr:K(+) efflux antiporter 2, chloroplastic-like [Camellia sinensis]
MASGLITVPQEIPNFFGKGNDHQMQSQSHPLSGWVWEENRSSHPFFDSVNGPPPDLLTVIWKLLTGNTSSLELFKLLLSAKLLNMLFISWLLHVKPKPNSASHESATRAVDNNVWDEICNFKKCVPSSVLHCLSFNMTLAYKIAFYTNRVERINQLFLQPDIITSGINEVSSNTKPLIRQIRKLPKRVKKLMEMIPYQEVNEEEASLFGMSWLLFASVIYVPIFQKIPGGSPVLGYLTAVILIGPYGLSIIHHVHETKAIAEFEVVFLMFNIGLELSVERLSTMKKYVFGLGSAQVLVTAVVVGLVSRFIAGQPSPAAIIIGNGLALSSTAVVLQVLQE